MSYNKQTWADGDTGGTPISATRLNYIENGIAAAASTADAAASTANAAIPAAQKGVANGVASLDSTGNVPATQLANAPTTILTAAKKNNTARSSTTAYSLDPELTLTLPVGTYLIETTFWTQGAAYATMFAVGGTAVMTGLGYASMTAFENNGQSGRNAYMSTSPGSNSLLNAGWLAGDASNTTLATQVTASQVIQVTTAGTIGLSWTQNTSSSFANTVFAGSFFRATKIG